MSKRGEGDIGKCVNEQRRDKSSYLLYTRDLQELHRVNKAPVRRRKKRGKLIVKNVDGCDYLWPLALTKEDQKMGQRENLYSSVFPPCVKY